MQHPSCGDFTFAPSPRSPDSGPGKAGLRLLPGGNRCAKRNGPVQSEQLTTIGSDWAGPFLVNRPCASIKTDFSMLGACAGGHEQTGPIECGACKACAGGLCCCYEKSGQTLSCYNSVPGCTERPLFSLNLPTRRFIS